MKYDTPGREALTDILRKHGRNRALARELGVSESTIWHWKNGSRRPSSGMRDAIEKVTGIPQDQWCLADDEWLNCQRRERSCASPLAANCQPLGKVTHRIEVVPSAHRPESRTIDTRARQRLISELKARGRGAQARLAEDIGVEPSAIPRWVSGECRPDAVFRTRLSRAIGIPEADWLTEDELRLPGDAA